MLVVNSEADGMGERHVMVMLPTALGDQAVMVGQTLQAGPNSNTRLWSISGSVSNANPNAWVAVRNGNDLLYVYGSNNFTFPTPYVNNTLYRVTIAGADPSLVCNITNNTGSIANARVSNVAVSCGARPPTQFANSFETFDRPADWANTVDDSWGSGGKNNVFGYCCGMPGPQAMTTDLESAHTGNGALVFSGTTFGNTTDQRAYLKVFDLSMLDLVGGAYLSYWIFPQSQASAFGESITASQSAFSAMDLTVSNGTALHFLPGLVDQFGAPIAPASQGNLVLDMWNYVLVDISSVSLDPLTNLSIGWANNTGSGGYRGYIDDINIDYVPPPSSTSISTSWEAFQIQPSWMNSADNLTGGGHVANVAGICCGATGAQTYRSSEMAHTGNSSLVYAGRGMGFDQTYAFTKILDLSHSNLTLDGLSTLTYWVYPQSQATFASVSGSSSANVALDIVFSDGSALRNSGLLDKHGNGVTPSLQASSLELDSWNLVTIPLGALAGKVPVRIDVGWSAPGAMGGYRGFIDDISIVDQLPRQSGRPPALVRIILAPASTLLVGAGIQLVATGVYADGSTRSLGNTAVYTSSNPAIAAVDANGYMVTQSLGQAQITASYGTVTSPSYPVRVTPVTYKLGGTVSGLLVNTTVNLNFGVDHIAVSNGAFQFPTGVAAGVIYAAGLTSPFGQTCSFVGGSNGGSMPSADTSSIVVTCIHQYNVGGSISGLLTNTNVTLTNGNDLVSQSNSAYLLPTVLAYGAPYNITITNPIGQICAFSPPSAGSGTVGTPPVVSPNVVCHTDPNAARYVMSAFDNTSASNLYIYTSSDASAFFPIDSNTYTPPGGTVIRDPSVMRHTNGWYYIVYTANTTGSKFSMARSRDLLTWSFVGDIDMAAVSGESVTATLAPEWFRDELQDSIYVLVSTQVSNNVDDCGGARFTPHLIAATDTSATTTFSQWTDVGISATTTGNANKFVESSTSSNYADGQIIWTAATYHLFVVNELTKYLEHGTATAVTGPYSFTGGEGDWASWQGAAAPDGCAATQRAPLYLDAPVFLAQEPSPVFSMFFSAYNTGKYYTSTTTNTAFTGWSAPSVLGQGLGGLIRHATVIDAYASPFNVGLATDSDNNGSLGYSDWDSGYVKHACAPGQALAGFSSFGGNRHKSLCKMPVAPLDPNLALTQGDTVGVNAMLSSRSGSNYSGSDFDYGNYKSECSTTEYIVGISNWTSDNQHINAVRCAESGQNITKNCVSHFIGSDDRGNFSTLDWDVNYYKMECGGDQLVVGISVDTTNFRIHSILCCSR